MQQGIGFVTCPQTRGTLGVTCGYQLPETRAHSPPESLQNSRVKALQFQLFICISFVFRFRTYCVFVTVCSSTSDLSASSWNLGGKIFLASSSAGKKKKKNEAQGCLGLCFLFCFFSHSSKTSFTASSPCALLEQAPRELSRVPRPTFFATKLPTPPGHDSPSPTGRRPPLLRDRELGSRRRVPPALEEASLTFHVSLSTSHRE